MMIMNGEAPSSDRTIKAASVGQRIYSHALPYAGVRRYIPSLPQFHEAIRGLIILNVDIELDVLCVIEALIGLFVRPG
jgi:hypothetical protein